MNRKSLRVLGLITLLGACATAPKKPDWVSGKTAAYPPEQYFVAIGKAPLSANPAETQTSADQDAVSQLESALSSRIKSQLAAELSRELAGLSSDQKAKYAPRLSEEVNAGASLELEGIVVADHYCEPKKGFCYALAMLDRNKAGADLWAKLNDQELSVSDLLRRERESLINRDPLSALGILLAAEKALARQIGLRAQYLAVSGDSAPAKYSLSGLVGEQEMVKNSVSIMVFVYAQAPLKNPGAIIEQYLVAGLGSLGFSAFPAPAELKKKNAGQVKALLQNGALHPRPEAAYVLLASLSTKKIGVSREAGVPYQIYRTGAEMHLYDVNTRASLLTMFDTAPEATKAQDPRSDRAAELSVNQAGEYFAKIWVEILKQRYLTP